MRESFQQAEDAPVRSYVVDTNVFNCLVDGSLIRDRLPGSPELVAMHVQIDEINNTRNADRRQRLLQIFEEIAPRIVPTESGIWGNNSWGQSKWSDGLRHARIKTALDARRFKANNVQDAQILEVAIVNGYGLITADRILASVAKDQEVLVMFVAQ